MVLKFLLKPHGDFGSKTPHEKISPWEKSMFEIDG